MSRRTSLQSSELWIEMPKEYSDHPLCKQLITLKDEDELKDVDIIFGASGRVERISGFLLSLLSPVWRARLCGEFSHGRQRRVELEEDEAEAVTTVVKLGCGGGGRPLAMRRGLEELIEVGCVAERYQMVEVRRAVEEEAMRHLTLETCGGLLMACERCGLRGVEGACRRLALERFEELTTTEGFMEIGEEMLRSLLDDNELECGREDKVFEGVIRWMKGDSGGEVRGESLLDAIRFPLMSKDYLLHCARTALEGSERLERRVSEALMLKGVPAGERGKHACHPGSRALRQRLLRGVRWEEYGEGRRGARRLAELPHYVYSLADGGDWVCAGHAQGGISVWNKASLGAERTLTGHTGCVSALAVCEGWLVSGSTDEGIRVWDVRGGRCVRTLEGHTASVLALAVGDGALLSGSGDGTIRAWRLEGPPAAWRCERALAGHGGGDRVWSVAWWRGKAVSGGRSGAIRVWDLSTGGCVRTLLGHTDGVTALVVTGGRLVSAAWDKTVREWFLESGACLKAVRAYPAESPQFIKCLAVSGRRLVGGSNSTEDSECEVVVWDLDAWAEGRPRRLRQPAGQQVRSVLAMEGEVWAGVGGHMLVWGRDG